MTLSDEEAERLRSRVPDNPIPLPMGHLACDACGVAVPVDVFAEVIEPKKARRSPYIQCPDCLALHQRAVELAGEHPFLNSRLGAAVVIDRIEWTLWGLAVIGQTMRAADIGVMLARIYGLGHKVGFRSLTGRASARLTPGRTWESPSVPLCAPRSVQPFVTASRSGRSR